MRKLKTGLTLTALALATAGLAPAYAAVPVIPGATGYGIDTPAGRGGKVMKVTNLNASGSGSLRACAESSGPRVCVFEVSGTIKLDSDIKIRNPYLTIAGQTAPSPGINIRGATMRVLDTHDVLIQHLRFRIGDDSNNTDPSNRDAIAIAAPNSPTYNVVLDHISASWAIDETVQIWYGGVSDVTVRNSIMGQALENHRFASQTAGSGGGPGKGPILGKGVNRVLFNNNLVLHNKERNPRSQGDGLVFANNVLYNWSQKGIDIGEGSSSSAYSIVGNAFMRGNDDANNPPIYFRSSLSSGVEVYLADNQLFSASGTMEVSADDPWRMVRNDASYSPQVSSSPIWPADFKPLPVGSVVETVLTGSGARPADRDSLDRRLVDDVRAGSGRIIDSPSDVGGWPALENNVRRLTLPDSPNADDDGDGYTNLEEWLHAFAAEVEGRSDFELKPPMAPARPQVTIVNASN